MLNPHQEGRVEQVSGEPVLCPYCRDGTLRWKGAQRFGSCRTCARPLVTINLPRSGGMLRLVSALDLVRTIVGIFGAFAVLAVLLPLGSLRPGLMMVTAFMLVSGATELLDGILAINARVARLRGQILLGRRAAQTGVIKVAFGAASLVTGVAGVVLLSTLEILK